jgi:hypothetical protein
MFCKVLPVDILPPGSEIPVAEYHFSQLEERLKEEDGPYECGVYFAVQDLYRFWLDNRYITWSRPLRWTTCHLPELGWYRKVFIDSGKTNQHPLISASIRCQFLDMILTFNR